MGRQTGVEIKRLYGLERQLLWAVALIFSVALMGVAIGYGSLNQDEGWYLYAARQVNRGMYPYSDFLFTQGPLMPRLYAVFVPLWLPYGLLGGRMLTAFFGVAALALAALVSARLAPRSRRMDAALICVLLLGLNPYHAYHMTVVKSYAAAGMLMLAGIYFLTLRHSYKRISAFGSGIMLAAAASVRLSLVMAIVVVALYLLQQRRHPFGWQALLLYLAGVTAMLALCFLPDLIRDYHAVWFGLTLHLERATGEGMNFIFARAGYLARLIRFYYLPVLIFLLAAGVLWRHRRKKDGDKQDDQFALLRVITVLFLLLLLIHGVAPMPYDEYQVPAMPLLAVLAAVLATRSLETFSASAVRKVLRSLMLATCLAAFSSSLLQDWVILRHDRLWLVSKPQTDLNRLRETAGWLKEQFPDTAEILTQDLYLAIELNWDVPRGFEMGPFNYFPALDDASAARYRVLNRNLMRRIIEETTAPVAAFSGYGFAVAAPAMEAVPHNERKAWLEMLGRNYSLVHTVNDFGQGHTTLKVYERIQE